jgi:DNA-binding response OmpR family regulator
MGFSGPILGITGNVMPEDVQLFLEMGADEVLMKPLHMEDFHKALVAHSNKKK